MDVKIEINKVTELCPICGTALLKIPKSKMSGYVGKPYYVCTEFDCDYWRVIAEDETVMIL